MLAAMLCRHWLQRYAAAATRHGTAIPSPVSRQIPSPAFPSAIAGLRAVDRRERF